MSINIKIDSDTTTINDHTQKLTSYYNFSPTIEYIKDKNKNSDLVIEPHLIEFGEGLFKNLPEKIKIVKSFDERSIEHIIVIKSISYSNESKEWLICYYKENQNYYQEVGLNLYSIAQSAQKWIKENEIT